VLKVHEIHGPWERDLGPMLGQYIFWGLKSDMCIADCTSYTCPLNSEILPGKAHY
jgi:hypothetical protein